MAVGFDFKTNSHYNHFIVRQSHHCLVQVKMKPINIFCLCLPWIRISCRFCTLLKTIFTFCHLRKCSLVRQQRFSQMQGMYDTLLTANTEASWRSVCSYRGSILTALYLTPTLTTYKTFIASNEPLLHSVAEMWVWVSKGGPNVYEPHLFITSQKHS